jgi:signal transduction histidine kinase
VLVVGVVDDGVGGADPDGAGLRGLADRVAAAGGRCGWPVHRAAARG